MSQTTPPAPTTPTRRGRTPWISSLVTALLAVMVVLLVMLAFLWPTLTSTPRGLELDVVGGDRAQSLVDGALDAVEEKTDSRPFDTTAVDSRAEAEDRIHRMESYGAVVVDDAGNVEVLTATAANATAAQLLQQVAAQIGQAAGAEAQTAADAAARAREAAASAAMPSLTVTDLAPHPDADPRGAGFALAGLPMTLGGIVGGSLLSMRLRGTWRRLLGILAYGVIGGWAIVAVLGPWLGILAGDTLELWAVVGLSLLGTGSVIMGLHSLIGGPGIGIGAVITMLVANPISGAQAPGAFLPGAWGQIGQYFVPGATASLLRAVSFFPDADPVRPWLVLTAWALAGAALIMAGHHRTGGHAHRGSAGEALED